MTFFFHPDAEDEFVDAVAYYEVCDPSLGIDFSREVYETVRNVVEYPTMWPEIGDDVRRCLVHRFPYGVLFSIEPDGIFILAVMPLHRDPDYWRHRLGGGWNKALNGNV